MHLLMIAPEQIPVPAFKGGSVEICMDAIAKKIARHHKVTLISRRHPKYPHVSTSRNLKYIRVPSGTPGRYLASVLAYLRGKHYDWIQIDNRPRFITPIKNLFPNIPISLFLHSLTFVSAPMISRDRAAKHLSRADMIVANSNSLERELKSRFNHLHDKIKQVYLGVDLNQFRPPTLTQRKQLRSRYGLKGSFVFAFAGRIISRKGIPVMMKALSQVRKSVPNVKMIIAGNGKPGYIAKLKDLAKRLHITAKFIGYKSHHSMHEVYWLADCFVCPSQKHEAFGLVNVEAMAAGIPVVASRIGGIKEIISHAKNGYLINRYSSAHDFAIIMEKLAQNPALASSLGKQARKDVVNRFSWTHTANNLSNLYGM